jgi:WD40 repeat protein
MKSTTLLLLLLGFFYFQRGFSYEFRSLVVYFDARGDRITHAFFSPDSKTMVVASADGVVKSFKTNGRLLFEKRIHRKFNELYFSQDGKRIIAKSGERVSVFNAVNGKMLKFNRVIDARPESGFSPDGKFKVIKKSTTELAIKNREDREVLVVNTGRQIAKVFFSPDGFDVVVIATDGNVDVFDAWTGNHSKNLAKSNERILSLALSGDGEKVLLVTKDDRAKFLLRAPQDFFIKDPNPDSPREIETHDLVKCLQEYITTGEEITRAGFRRFLKSKGKGYRSYRINLSEQSKNYLELFFKAESL